MLVWRCFVVVVIIRASKQCPRSDKWRGSAASGRRDCADLAAPPPVLLLLPVDIV